MSFYVPWRLSRAAKQTDSFIIVSCRWTKSMSWLSMVSGRNQKTGQLARRWRAKKGCLHRAKVGVRAMGMTQVMHQRCQRGAWMPSVMKAMRMTSLPWSSCRQGNFPCHHRPHVVVHERGRGHPTKFICRKFVLCLCCLPRARPWPASAALPAVPGVPPPGPARGRSGTPGGRSGSSGRGWSGL